MNKLIRIIIILAVIGGAAFGIYSLIQRRQQTQSETFDIIRSETIEQGTLVLSVPASGHISAKQDRMLALSLPAMVTENQVDVGDRVQTGDVLARVDTETLEFAIRQSEYAMQLSELSLGALETNVDERDLELADMAIQEASYAMASANASIALAEAQAAQNNEFAQDAYEATQDAYDNLTETLDRYNLPEASAAPATASLMEAEGNVGITEFQGNYSVNQAQSQYQMAYQSYTNAQNQKDALLDEADPDQIRQQELNIEQAKLDLQSAKENLQDVELIAPFDGIIAMNALVQGNFAVPGVPQIRLLDDSIFFVDVNIDEIDISDVSLGQVVEVILDAYPDSPLPGTVSSISSVPTNMSGIVGYTVRVELVSSDEVTVRHGMTANVVIETGEIADVLLVPNWAIKTDEDTGLPYVYVDRNGDISQQEITTDVYRNDVYSIITSGLNEGDTVVLVAEEREFEFPGGPGNRM